MLQVGIIVGGGGATPTPQPGVPPLSLFAGGASDCEVANGVDAASLPWSLPSFALAINNYWLLLRRPASDEAHFSSVTFLAEATRAEGLVDAEQSSPVTRSNEGEML
jgi:hypothetical protein